MTVKPRTNLLLDIVLLVIFLAVLGTGLLLWLDHPSGSVQVRHGHNRTATIPTGQDSVLDRQFLTVVHEWGGLLVGIIVLTHLVFHLKWITCQLGRLFKHPRAARTPAPSSPRPNG